MRSKFSSQKSKTGGLHYDNEKQIGTYPTSDRAAERYD